MSFIKHINPWESYKQLKLHHNILIETSNEECYSPDLHQSTKSNITKAQITAIVLAAVFAIGALFAWSFSPSMLALARNGITGGLAGISGIMLISFVGNTIIQIHDKIKIKKLLDTTPPQEEEDDDDDDESESESELKLSSEDD
jgi:hypothetical protein